MLRVHDFPSLSLISAEFPYRNKLISMPKFFSAEFPQFLSFLLNLHTEINSFPCLSFCRMISLISGEFTYRNKLISMHLFSAELREILGKLKENNDSVRKFLGRSHIWLPIYVSICIGHIMLVLLNTASWKFNDFDLNFPCYPMSDHIK